VLRSHREPSRFQKDFGQLGGCIYHLGNPACDDPGYEGMYFAYELLSERCREAPTPRFLEFAPQYLPAVVDLLAILLAGSPARVVVFTTDWQFGPKSSRRYRTIREGTFWRCHRERRLHLNALYHIRPDDSCRAESVPSNRSIGP
jgi:hypothetical protein